jgi:hypothetical protein
MSEIENPRLMEHLGDGLCVDYDGEQIRLFTPREEGIHEVYMNRNVLGSFLDYLITIGLQTPKHEDCK